MSSIRLQNPTNLLQRRAVCFNGIGASLAVMASPLAAQNETAVTAQQESAPQESIQEQSEDAASPAPPQSSRPAERRIIDLTITKPRNPSDQLIEEDCDEEADAARIAGEILVCRQVGEATDGSWNKEEFERGYAQRTQGEKPVDVAGGGIFRGPATVSGLCVIPPCPPEAALIIDIEALPEAPEGSDADRISRGLPPLGQDEELTPEEIQRRRRAAGLDAPDLPGQ